jgi:hypothetical protein
MKNDDGGEVERGSCGYGRARLQLLYFLHGNCIFGGFEIALVGGFKRDVEGDIFM